MVGLFQELGPCRIKNDSTGVDLNPTSWNNNANVLFIDQPVGVGFSYGTESVNTSELAAADVWKFLQIWFADPRFNKYASRDFGIWTESYGGHYGPTFAAHFLEQNAAIQNGTHQGNYMHFSFGVKDFDLGFRYFPHFSVLLLLIPRTLAFLYLTLAYA
jgi:carboxypeptidase C (cathepsin A)